MKFTSQHRNYRLVHTPSTRDYVGGRWVTKVGIVFEFIDGKFETKTQEDTDFFLSHPCYGIDFHKLPEEGAKEEGSASSPEVETVEVDKPKRGRPKNVSPDQAQ